MGRNEIWRPTASRELYPKVQNKWSPGDVSRIWGHNVTQTVHEKKDAAGEEVRPEREGSRKKSALENGFAQKCPLE